MRPKLLDRLCLGFGTCIFAGLTYFLCWGMFTTVKYSLTYGVAGGFPLFMFWFAVPLWIMSIVLIPVCFCVTLMFGGWVFGKDIFKIDGDKYDQVEFNFREK